MKSPDSKDRPHAGGKAKTAAGSSRPSPSNRTKTDHDDTQKNRTNWWESKLVTLDMHNKGPAGERVERLMGTSVVKFTDRKYMMQLQEKILESHYESTEKRMNNRMNEEIEREKRLILENKMPAVDIPGIANHPVFVVRSHMANNPRSAALGASKKRYAKPQDMETAIRAQEEQEKRMDVGSRVKRKKKRSLKDNDEKEGSITNSRVSVDTAEVDRASTTVLFDSREFAKEGAPEPELAAGRTRRLLRTGAEDGGDPDRQDGDMHTTMTPALDDSSDQNGEWVEDDENAYQIHGSLSDQLGYSPSLGSNDEETSESNCSMLSSGKDTERIKYEAPLVKELRRAETVEQLYELAEQIVGPVPPCVPSK